MMILWLSITLPFTFNWQGGSRAVVNVQVSTNGQINVDGSTDENCCDADPTRPGNNNTATDYDGARIAVAREDLDLTLSGGVFTQDQGTSFIISLVQVNFARWRKPDGLVNAQAELFPDGRVYLCWGDVASTLDSRVEDDDMNMFYPAPGFDAEPL